MTLIRTGDQGDLVKSWQSFLNQQGFDCGVADGIFGANTANATKAFQSAHGLSADGIAGPNTISVAKDLGFSLPVSGFPPAGNINVVVDISHHQASADFQAVKGDGILGVISKATQGTTYTDPTYAERRVEAKAQGLLWGAYHFGTGQDVDAQVSHFLATAAPDDQTLLVLDWENNPVTSQGTMPLEQARAFLSAVKEQLGQFPVLYCGILAKEQIPPAGDEILNQCPLWIAQYTQNVSLPHGWSSYTMWQYTDGTHGNSPHSVNGIGNCDRDVFAGSVEDLHSMWRSKPIK
ncbi:MAG: GH25 family lysozyme [Bacteroidota bacterium]